MRSATRSRAGRDEVLQRLRAVVDSIPRGRVATYGQVAREAGLPRHARHVGRALGSLPPQSALPWHRVLNARGAISERACQGFVRQRSLLEAEGVAFDGRGRVDLERFGWRFCEEHDPDTGSGDLPRKRVP